MREGLKHPPLLVYETDSRDRARYSDSWRRPGWNWHAALFRREVAVSTGALAWRYLCSGAAWVILFSDRDLHFAQRGFEFDFLGDRAFPPVIL